MRPRGVQQRIGQAAGAAPVGHAQIPAARHPDADGQSGRGLALVNAIASAWGAEPGTTGTLVWFTVAT